VLSYDLLLKLLLKHKSHSHSSFLSELLLIITLTNINTITRTKQTKHIKDKAEVITVAEVSGEALEATVTLEAIAVSEEAEAVADITHLHVRKSVISVTSQVAGQRNTLLKNESKHTTSLVNILLVFIRHLRPYTTRAF
jgi:hypothetical protein